MVVGTKLLKRFKGWNFENDYHKGSHKEAGIRQHLWLVRAVMEYFERFVLIVLPNKEFKVQRGVEQALWRICASLQDSVGQNQG